MSVCPLVSRSWLWVSELIESGPSDAQEHPVKRAPIKKTMSQIEATGFDFAQPATNYFPSLFKP